LHRRQVVPPNHPVPLHVVHFKAANATRVMAAKATVVMMIFFI